MLDPIGHKVKGRYVVPRLVDEHAVVFEQAAMGRLCLRGL
jgi:hypothetical protein